MPSDRKNHEHEHRIDLLTAEASAIQQITGEDTGVWDIARSSQDDFYASHQDMKLVSVPMTQHAAQQLVARINTPLMEKSAADYDRTQAAFVTRSPQGHYRVLVSTSAYMKDAQDDLQPSPPSPRGPRSR